MFYVIFIKAKETIEISVTSDNHNQTIGITFYSKCIKSNQLKRYTQDDLFDIHTFLHRSWFNFLLNDFSL